MSDIVDSQTELLVFGYVSSLSKKQCPTPITCLCLDYYYENDFFTKSKWHRLQNNNKTAISLWEPAAELECWTHIHCNNYVGQIESDQAKVSRWRFKVNEINTDATIIWGLATRSKNDGADGMWCTIHPESICVEKNDILDIYISFSDAECELYTCINDQDYEFLSTLDHVLVKVCNFTIGWETNAAGIKITLVNYKSMHPDVLDL